MGEVGGRERERDIEERKIERKNRREKKIEGERASEEEVGFVHNSAWAFALADARWHVFAPLALADAQWQSENFQSPKQKTSSVSCQRQRGDQAGVDLILGKEE